MSKTRTKKLNRSFYNRPTLHVAAELIGKVIVYKSTKGILKARIVEVEAYIGCNDPACHAARGMTKRNEVMFGKPGFAYIYFIYGMYHCFNIVTEPKGMPAAILLRAAEPIDNLEWTSPQNNKNNSEGQLLSGPGKFCREFGLNREQNGLDLTGDILYLQERNSTVEAIEKSPRIGIKVGTELLWRFYDKNSKAVSGKKRDTQ